MAENQKFILLDRKTITADEKGKPFPMGAWNYLELQIHFHKSGTGGNIQMQHSAFDEEETFGDLGDNVLTTTVGSDYQTIANHLDYVRWTADGSVAGDPVVSIAVLAKK